MKPIPEGTTATLQVTVTDAMTVCFGELGALHPVYATYVMAQHFEEAARKLLLPFLELGENGLGSAVSVLHTASALPGMPVTITATLERVEGRRLHCHLRAETPLGEIGTGTTTQVVLPQERIDQNFEALRARWAEETETHFNTGDQEAS